MQCLVVMKEVQGSISVRLKLAFCMTCAVRVLVLAQGPSFSRLRRALLGQRGDSQVERKATITSGKVKTIPDEVLRSSPKRSRCWILVSEGYLVRVGHVSVNPSCRVSKWTGVVVPVGM